MQQQDERFRRERAPRGDFVVGADHLVPRKADFMGVLRGWREPGEGPWIAGGALRDYARGEAPQDIDVFFRNEAQRMMFQSTLASRVTCSDYALLDNTDHVTRIDTGVGRVELIKKHYFRNAAALLSRFDFVACCAAVDAKGNLTEHRDFRADVAEHRMCVNALPTPVTTYWRAHRFLKRGWQLSRDEYSGIATAAVERAEDWGQDQYSGDPLVKGLPPWAEAAWSAVRSTGDRGKLPLILRRAVEQEGWVAGFESMVLLEREASKPDSGLFKGIVHQPKVNLAVRTWLQDEFSGVA
jgi:uncharacterized protein (DUF1778 family)